MSFKLQEGEKVLWEGKPENRIYVLWFFSKVLGSTIAFSGIAGYLSMMLCVAYAAIRHLKQPVFFPIVSVLIVVVPMSFLLTLLYYWHLKETFHYAITDQRCVFSGGILVRRLRSVPFYKITDVEINQNIVENWLRISKVKFFTAGTGSAGSPGVEQAEIVFVGLKDAEAPASVVQGALKRFKATGE